MPTFDIVKTSNPKKTFRVASVMGTFDLQENQVTEHFVGNIELPKNWQIGLIVGNSGTGKTTIAKELFPDAYITNYKYTHESILDDMPQNASVEDITKTFTSCGFASVPSWLKRYDVLSNGEKMRVDLARAILEDRNLVVFDEFTSVVDRQVAKIGSFAMQKAIRKTNKQFIAVTCHFDVEDWLLPDWVFNTNDMTFHLIDEGQKKNRPTCRLEIFEVEPKAKKYYWNTFKKYHYLSSEHNNSASAFVATLNGKLCGYLSVIHFPCPANKNIKKVHRLVVLPDFQGLGIGRYLLEYVGQIYKSKGKDFTITSSNPSLVYSLKKSNRFICDRIGRMKKENSTTTKSFVKSISKNRITAHFKFH